MATGIYGVNFHAQELRLHSGPNRIKFGATDDTVAAAIAAALAAGVTAQQTSFMKQIYNTSPTPPYIPGSGYTLKAVLRGAGTSAYTVRLRNWNPAKSSSDAAALFKGVVGTSILALGAVPQLPNNSTAVSHVSVTVVERY